MAAAWARFSALFYATRTLLSDMFKEKKEEEDEEDEDEAPEP